MSQQESIVLEARLEQHCEVYAAPYFVEHGVVHARIGDHILLVPLVGGNAAEIVRTLLRGHLVTLARRSSQRSVWQHTTQARSRP